MLRAYLVTGDPKVFEQTLRYNNEQQSTKLFENFAVSTQNFEAMIENGNNSKTCHFWRFGSG